MTKSDLYAARVGKTTDDHDIAVSDVTVFKTVVGQGYTMGILFLATIAIRIYGIITSN